MKKTWKHSWAAAILGATALVTTSTSHAAVVVYFEQVGSDVVATWSGTLDPGMFGVEGPSVGQSSASQSYSLRALTDGTQEDRYTGGVFNPTGLGGVISYHTGFGHFGFWNYNFLMASNTTGADYDSVTPIDFDSATVTMTYTSQTLAGIGADSFSDTLAWTSSTGDTIRYTTGSPVPEPASGLLCGVGLLGALLHRRRR